MYVGDPGRLVFHPLGPPTLEQVENVAHRTALRTARILERFGLCPDIAMPERAAIEDPVLSALLSASAQGIDLLSDRCNQPALRLVGTPPTLRTSADEMLVAEVRGINVHAASAVKPRMTSIRS